MNLDDLRTELNARAGEVDPAPQGRMAGIRAKAAARRRRRAGATVAAAVVAVGAIVGVPVLTEPSAGPDSAESAGPFPAEVNGDTRVSYQVGDKGETRVSLTFTPDDTDFQLSVSCRWSGAAARSAHLSVNGAPLSVRCPSDGDAVGGPIAVGADANVDVVREYWRRRDVEPGTPVRITLVAEVDRDDPLRRAVRAARERARSASAARVHADEALANATTLAERRRAKGMVLRTTRTHRQRQRELNAAGEVVERANSSVALGIAVYDMTD